MGELEGCQRGRDERSRHSVGDYRAALGWSGYLEVHLSHEMASIIIPGRYWVKSRIQYAPEGCKLLNACLVRSYDPILQKRGLKSRRRITNRRGSGFQGSQTAVNQTGAQDGPGRRQGASRNRSWPALKYDHSKPKNASQNVGSPEPQVAARSLRRARRSDGNQKVGLGGAGEQQAASVHYRHDSPG